METFSGVCDGTLQPVCFGAAILLFISVFFEKKQDIIEIRYWYEYVFLDNKDQT